MPLTALTSPRNHTHLSSTGLLFSSHFEKIQPPLQFYIFLLPISPTHQHPQSRVFRSSSQSSSKMGKIPVKIKAVQYALSPYQQKVMPGLWKDLPNKLTHKVTENWLNATLLLGPLVGVYSYVQWYQEKEKLEHRFQIITFFEVLLLLPLSLSL